MGDSTSYQLRRSRPGRRQQTSTGFDIHLALPVLLLVAFGIAMVFSASYPKVVDSKVGAFYFVKRQALSACIGVVACIIAWRLRRELLVRLAYPALGFALFSLVVVHFIGRDINGARSWISLGPFSFQPSELAKLTLTLALARLLSERPESVSSLKSMLPAFGLTAAVCGFVVLGKDLGTTLVCVASVFVLLYLAGARLKHLAQAGGLAGLLSAAAVCAEPYRIARITSFLNPEAHLNASAYQISRGLIALGSGGMFGVGFSRSREKFFYLPEPHTDCIFAVVGEELGLACCLAVLALFLWIGWRGLLIARQSPDRFSALGAAGMTNMILIGAATNLLVITGMMPPTGLPLTFISYGGSSLIFALVTVGILANFSRHLEPDDGGNRGDPPRAKRESASALGAEVVARTLRPRGM